MSNRVDPLLSPDVLVVIDGDTFVLAVEDRPGIHINTTTKRITASPDANFNCLMQALPVYREHKAKWCGDAEGGDHE